MIQEHTHPLLFGYDRFFTAVGLGVSAKATLASAATGIELGDSLTIGVEGYVGVGFTLDLSNGIEFGIGLGLGLEFDFKFDWLSLFN